MREDLYVLGYPVPRERKPIGQRVRSLVKVSIVLVTLVLMTGLGGEAIAGSPGIVPALWWALGEARTRAGRIGITLLASLVMTEVGWYLAYASIGERQPYISGSPVLAFLVTDALFSLRSARLDRRQAQ
jgi:hypothetical protein